LTTIENTEATETANTSEATVEQTVKYPTYAELAKATWMLAFRMSECSGAEDTLGFCVSGTNEFLDAFDLPRLGQISRDNLEQVDDYVDAWLKFKYWQSGGELSPEEDVNARDVLSRTITATLARREPASRTKMNEWLRELGLDELKAPRRRRAYEIHARPFDGQDYLTVEQLRDAINAAHPGADVRVEYY
jgi:hypothetical protein